MRLKSETILWSAQIPRLATGYFNWQKKNSLEWVYNIAVGQMNDAISVKVCVQLNAKVSFQLEIMFEVRFCTWTSNISEIPVYGWLYI